MEISSDYKLLCVVVRATLLFLLLSPQKTFPEPSAGAQHLFGITTLEKQARTILRLLNGAF